MKTLFFKIIVFAGCLLSGNILQAQEDIVIRKFKQYKDLEEAGNDTLKYLLLNYCNTYEMKPVKQILADLRSEGFVMHSCVLDDKPAGQVKLICFLEPMEKVKEKYKKNLPLYECDFYFAYDLCPTTPFEECRIVYDKLVKFGLNKLQPFSKELQDIINNINLDYMYPSYETIKWLKYAIEE